MSCLGIRQDGLGFDLDQPGRIEQSGHDHGGRGGADVGEDLAVRPGDLVPVGGVGDIYAGPDDVLEAAARVGQGFADEVQAQLGLGVSPGRGGAASRRDRRGAGNRDPAG